MIKLKYLSVIAVLCCGLLLAACGNDTNSISSESLASLQAAKQGDAQAQYNIGLSYDLGQGFPQNWSEAEDWYRKAAEQGHANAQRDLGLLLYEGRGQPGGRKEKAEAEKWFLRAAEQGHRKAQNDLGLLYDDWQNWSEALKWYREAAARGNANAQRNLGIKYYKGLGVPQNYTLAYAWFSVASRQGLPIAKDGRDLAAAKLDFASLAKAEKLAEQYYKSYVEPFQ